jgi:hypothetical protein
MATPELSDDENAHLRALLKAALPRYGSQNQLAAKLEMAGSSLGKIIEKGGGASKATARRFAELEGKTFEEVLGRGGQDRRTPPMPQGGPPAFPPTARALKIARRFLKQKPQEIEDEVIDQAVPDTFLTTQKDADSPSAVAEALRHTIYGSALHFPLHPNYPGTAAPSSLPPAGTRRSRMRGR